MFKRYSREVYCRGGQYKQLEVVDEVDNFKLVFDPEQGYIITAHSFGHGAAQMDTRYVWEKLKDALIRNKE